MDEKKMALIFKAFCDENRIRILKMLRSGEKCACKMLDELNVTQPTLSHIIVNDLATPSYVITIVL